MPVWIKKMSFLVVCTILFSGSDVFASKPGGARLDIAEEGFNFGTVDSDTVLQHIFSFKNSGTDTLFIKRVSSG